MIVKSMRINEVHHWQHQFCNVWQTQVFCAKYLLMNHNWLMPFYVLHVFFLSVVTYLSWFYLKLYWISVSSSSLKIPSPVVVWCGPVTEAKFSVQPGMDFLNKRQLNSTGNICLLIKSLENHSKSSALFLIDYQHCSNVLNSEQLFSLKDYES